MKGLFLLLGLFFVSSADICGQTKPDFSGNWTINVERTKSPISVAIKNVKQSESEIEILNDPDVIEIITGKKGQGTVYKLGGEEILKETETAAGKIPVLYSAKFVADKLEISRIQKDAQNQDVRSAITEFWSLADEGKTLNIKSVFKDSSGEKVSEVFFDKNPPGYDANLNTAKAAKVINGKARQLIKPSYPKEAREAKAQGDVFVRVLIDEKGDVVFAKALYGHPMLLQTSEQATLLCKFSPTKINNVASKVTGVIVYNFVKM